MINTVRTLVQAIANKHNYGYLSPADFDLFAKQSQLEEFEDLVFRYTQWKVMQNQGRAGSGLADLPENITQDIEIFTKSAVQLPAANGGGTEFLIPDDLYYIDPDYGLNIKGKMAGKVDAAKINMLLASDMMSPSAEFPMWVMSNGRIKVYPLFVSNQAIATYVRYPVDPMWGYSTFAGGEPSFNQSLSTDFELPLSYMPSLVIKIAGYLGINIREKDLSEYMNGKEIQEQQVKG